MNTCDIKVSVVVPVYNVEDYLRECVDSILGQTHKNIELILVEDGSVDGSLAICEEYEKNDGRVRVIKQHNAGASAARNAGIEASTGDYVIFVDSDDYIMNNAIESVVDCAIRTEADMVCWNMERMLFGVYTPYNWQMPHESVIEDIPLIQRHMLNRYANDDLLIDNLIVLGSPCNKLIRRSIFNNVFVRFDSKVVYQEDLLMFFNLLNHVKKVAYLNEVLYHYRWREGSITRQRKLDDANKWVDTIEGFKMAIKCMEADDDMRKCFDIYVVLVLKNVIFDCFCGHTDNEEERPGRKEYGEIVSRHAIAESLSNLDIKTLPGIQHKFIAFCSKKRLFGILLFVCSLYSKYVDRKREKLTAENLGADYYNK